MADENKESKDLDGVFWTGVVVEIIAGFFS